VEEEEARSKAIERGCKEESPRTRPANQRMAFRLTEAVNQVSVLTATVYTQNLDLSDAHNSCS
jgi:hypothetical protein